MSTLYVAIYDEWELYHCYLGGCSNDLKRLTAICEEELEMQHANGCSFSYIIHEIEIDGWMLEHMERSRLNDISSQLIIECETYFGKNGFDENCLRVETPVRKATYSEYHEEWKAHAYDHEYLFKYLECPYV